MERSADGFRFGRWFVHNRVMYIRVNERDNVGIIVDPEGVGTARVLPGGITAREAIPQGHKVALRDLEAGGPGVGGGHTHGFGAGGVEAGEPVLRYGPTIGFAGRAIAGGAWVREEMIRMPAPPPLDELSLSTAVPPRPVPLEGYRFEGYRNADGGVGTRNVLGIATTVQCVAPTVEYAARRIKAELLPHFPNVDDVVAVTHSYGCGVAIDAPGAAIPIRTLKHISLTANAGGVPLIVSLGCEKMQPARLFASELPVLAQLMPGE